MKKLFSLSLLAMMFFANAEAQVGQKIKKGAKKVGHKTAEVASKTEARITDNKYEGKVGPAGQTIYIDDHSKYYWVDEHGHRQYVAASALRDKPVKVKVK